MHCAVTVMALNIKKTRFVPVVGGRVGRYDDIAQGKLICYLFKVLYIRQKDMRTRCKRQGNIKHVYRI